ncbi:putative reverse transcriptase, RNA-dependent DNA polymerase, partial [Tanacetum coccineum]
ALKDESWVKAMQEELLQFKLQQVWILVDFPFRKKEIGTKWVFRNKRDKRSIVVKNKARLVAQGHRQEEGIDYDEVFALVARTEATRLFLAFTSYMGFLVYQMDVKSAFLYGKFEDEVYVHRPPGFVDFAHPYKVYKVVKALYGLHQAPRACYAQKILDEFHGRAYILFGTTATTPIESNKPLVKYEYGVEVDVHEYRLMIGYLMYLTASRPGIMFVVCACARYLKHQPKLRLWYPRDSPFELEAFSDSDYAGVSLDMKSTTGECQMMDYGFNFMNTKIHIDNESTITEAEYVAAAHCFVKNPVYHLRTKHIEIRHHFIRDCYEKRLIDVLKIHTDSNVADLLTKGFDVTRYIRRSQSRLYYDANLERYFIF